MEIHGFHIPFLQNLARDMPSRSAIISPKSSEHLLTPFCLRKIEHKDRTRELRLNEAVMTGAFATTDFTGAVASSGDYYRNRLRRGDDKSNRSSSNSYDDDSESIDDYGVVSDHEVESEIDSSEFGGLGVEVEYEVSGEEERMVKKGHGNDDFVTENEEDEESQGSGFKNRICILVTILLVVIGIIVGIVVGVSEEERSEVEQSPTPAEIFTRTPSIAVTLPPITQSPTQRPIDRNREIPKILASYGVTDPDSTALNWLVSDDTWLAMRETDWVERYGMVVFCQKTGKIGWLRPGVTHCDWKKMTCEDNKVTAMDLRDTDLSTVPTEIGYLTGLKKLSFENDPITVNGSIPSSITQLSNLDDLFMRNTGVTSIGVEILTMKSLTSFLMEEQELGSTIPTHLYSLTKLTSLKIRKCSLIGTISSEIAQLSKLTNLVMAENGLTGPFPQEMAQLTNLERFAGSSNPWSTSFPRWFGQLTKLGELKLGNSGLQGELPTEIALMTSLTKLNLRRNSFSGTIPLLPTSLSTCTLELNNFLNTTNSGACDI